MLSVVVSNVKKSTCRNFTIAGCLRLLLFSVDPLVQIPAAVNIIVEIVALGNKS